MIDEAYVSLETAKLLNEKGFDGQCHNYVDEEITTASHLWNTTTTITIPVPTQQIAMRWLREVHKLEIIIRPWFSFVTGNCKATYFWNISQMHEKHLVYLKNNSCDGYCKGESETYEEACDDAIRYCLINLI